MPDINIHTPILRGWKVFLIRKSHKKELLYTFILLALLLVLFTRFLKFVELRAGFSFNDPLLNLFTPLDLTWLIFGLIYLCLITALLLFVRDPRLLLAAFQSYIILLLFRTVAMFLLPLNPPAGMIPLNDPFVQVFGSGEILTKDLFFSGHTSLLFLFFLLSKEKIIKGVFLSCAIIVGISVLLQHVHYAIDVFTAPFFSYTSVKLAEYLKKKLPV